MAVRTMRLYGDPVLRQKARPVEGFDDALRELVTDMFDTMRAYRGVGLAANQVGVLQRVFVVEAVRGEGEEPLRLALVNPTLAEATGAETGEEGCLSVPGIYEDVRRALKVRVQARDIQGEPVDFIAEGYLARVLQHEADHLDGVLFLDRLSPLRRQFLKRPLEALARGELPDGYAHPGAGGRI
jgi:peptide deformylase